MIKNHPLSYAEKRKLHENELKVVLFYEKTTKRKFMRFDLILLKKLIRLATPEQINSQIKRFHYDKRYSKNFTDFFYIVQPVERMFKNRRGGKKNG